jgi:23S rRNA (uracil1939-C5)-methyltransferase
MQSVPVVKKGQEIELIIESLAYGGQGIARVEDFVVFVNGAIPGQRVNARIIKKKKSFAEARVLEVLDESPLAVVPRCAHFGSCGGCRLQNLDYEEQIKAKGDQVNDLLVRLGGLKNFEFSPTMPSEDIYYYRNKMEFSFSRNRWLTPAEIASDKKIEKQSLYLGFHAKGFFDKVIDLKECHLVTPIASDILSAVREIAIESGLPVYSTFDHVGFWRFLIIRPGALTSDLMVNVVTSRYDEKIAAELTDKLTSRFPQITSLVNGTTSSKASVAFSEKEYLLAGEPYITEKLGRYSFRISPNSFFQTSTRQAERLYDVVQDYANFSGDENLYDLYCGAGTISIYLSEKVRQVVGFESVESAVLDARKNCELNGVDNCQFVFGDLKDGISDTRHIISKYGRPDVIVLDPPRGGMHPKTINAVLALQAEKIVHVSCNPTTLARELAVMCEKDYTLVKVQPVDMFPHTSHVEVVALLIKN